MRMRPSLIIFSLIFGAALFIAKGLALCMALTALLFYMVVKNSGEKDRRFVVFILSLALILRIVAFIFMQYNCFSAGNLDALGDAQDNLIQGLQISDSLKNATTSGSFFMSPLMNRYNTHGKTVFDGIFFLFFGNDIISVKYLNLLAILLAGWLIYDLARKICSSLAGKTALTIFLFWPTLFIWSLMDLKESHLVMSLACAFWFLDRFRRSEEIISRVFFLSLSLIFSLYLISLKIALMRPIFVISAPLILFYYVLIYGFSRNPVLTRRILYIALMSLAPVVLTFRSSLLKLIKDFYGLIVHYHMGFLSSGGWNVDLIEGKFQDVYTLQFSFKYFVNGWLFFLFDPLPWHFYSYSLMAMYPILVVWYILLFFSVLGLIRLFRAGRGPYIFAMIVFVFVYVTVVGMSIANIGTMIRFRDAVLPVVAIFASVGLSGLWEDKWWTKGSGLRDG